MKALKQDGSGSITVFLTLLLAAVLSFCLVLLESARAPLLRTRADQASHAAMDCLMAGFQREMFLEYGVLFFDGGYGRSVVSEERIGEEFSAYFLKNAGGRSLLRLENPSAEICSYVCATDDQGEVFIRNALLLSEGAESMYGQREEENRAALCEGENCFSEGPDPGAILLMDPEEAAGDFVIRIARAEKKLREKGVLSLVLPMGTAVSGNTLAPSGLPSDLRENMPQYPEGSWCADPGNVYRFYSYLFSQYDSFSDRAEEVKRGEAETRALSYELEYLLFGHRRDEENLIEGISRLLRIRQGLALKALTGSAEAMSGVRAEAEKAAENMAREDLREVFSSFLLHAWAHAEALYELKNLLLGGTEVLSYDPAGIRLQLSQLPAFFQGALSAESGEISDGGLSYEEHLKLLFPEQDCSGLSYRAMDLIQSCMQQYRRDFQMSAQISEMEILLKAEAAPLFSGQRIVRAVSGRRSRVQEYSCRVRGSYMDRPGS